jgi:hypothetical protein
VDGARRRLGVVDDLWSGGGEGDLVGPEHGRSAPSAYSTATMV